MTDQTPPPAASAAPLTEAEDRQWASFAHLGGVLVGTGAGWLPALIIFLVFKDRGAFTNTESKEALNFQITAAIGMVIGWVLAAVFIGFLVIAAVSIAGIIFSILGFVASKDGKAYRYPVSIRLVK